MKRKNQAQKKIQQEHNLLLKQLDKLIMHPTPPLYDFVSRYTSEDEEPSDTSECSSSSSSLLTHNPNIYTTQEIDLTTHVTKPGKLRRPSKFTEEDEMEEIELWACDRERAPKQLKRSKKREEKTAKLSVSKKYTQERSKESNSKKSEGYQVMIDKESFNTWRKEGRMKLVDEFRLRDKKRVAKFSRNKCFFCGRKAYEWKLLLRHLKTQHKHDDVQLFNFSDDNADIELEEAKHLVILSAQVPKATKLESEDEQPKKFTQEKEEKSSSHALSESVPQIVYSKHRLLQDSSEMTIYAPQPSQHEIVPTREETKHATSKQKSQSCSSEAESPQIQVISQRQFYAKGTKAKVTVSSKSKVFLKFQKKHLR